MFIPNLPGDCLNMIYEGAPPGFCFVEFKLPAGAVPPGHKALQGLCRDGRVSSALFRQKVFKVFKDAVEKERRATGTQLNKTLRFACPLSVFLLSLFCLSTFCLFIVVVLPVHFLFFYCHCFACPLSVCLLSLFCLSTFCLFIVNVLPVHFLFVYCRYFACPLSVFFIVIVLPVHFLFVYCRCFACPLSVCILSLFCLSTFCLFIVIVSVATAPQ